MMRVPIPLALLLLSATAVAADEVHPIPLVLHPAAAPAPALKYRLLPVLADTIPGNAVTHYRRAVESMKADLPPEKEWRERVDQWLAVPLKDFPREEVGKFLQRCGTLFQELDAGAISEQCDWGLIEELRKKGLSASLDEEERMRAIGALMSLRIRCEVADHQTDKAARTLRTGFAVARHVGEAPAMIPSMTGMALAVLMTDRMEELLQQPEAPNFYWPLTDLPRPFIDLREAMQGDRVMAHGSFPGLAEMIADPNAKPMSAEQIRKLLEVRTLSEELKLPPPEAAAGVIAEFVVSARVLARHEAAKKRLIAQGRPKDLVDAMPHLQVALLDAFLQYDELLDDAVKWQSLPFWEAQPGMKEAAARADTALKDENGPVLPIGRLLLPATERIMANRVRLDRRIAALRYIEAVRLYAAGHDGKLPASLDDIKDVPLPPDPVNGKPFDYRVAGDLATLRCPPFPGLPEHSSYSPTYELRMGR